MKPFISIIFFLLQATFVFSQDPQPHFILNEPISPYVTRDYVASEYIQMIPNFRAHPFDDYYQVSAKINPLLVFPPEDGDVTGGATNNNNGGVVGTLPGNLMVSPTGAAVYNIPIDVPPGVAGMTPQLGLTYNSQGGNGLLGIGWSLTGLSAITRTGTNMYNDGYIDGVDFDGNDQLMLDGQRLIPINTQKTEFRTEIETFSKITCSGTAGDGPEQFLVKTKSGQILYYGSEETGRIEAEGRTSILTWCLNAIEDRQGNYIEFSYKEIEGIGIIDKIEYGGNRNTQQAPFYEINFKYINTRNDKITQYIVGSKVALNSLLEKVEINYSSELIKTYLLEYDETFYSRLVNVWQYAGGTSDPHLNPIQVQWGSDGDHDVNSYYFNKINTSRDIDHFFLDINGDGRTDDISIEYSIYNNAKKAESWYFRLRELNNSFSIPLPMGALPSTFYRHLLVGDYNGDGLQDFLEIIYTHENKEKSIVNRLFISQGNSFVECILNPIEYWQNNRPEFRVGDFDGDGISELLIAYKNIPENYDSDPNNNFDNVYIWKFNETSPYVQTVFEGQLGFGNTGFDGSVLIVGDFNGDGRSDVLRTAEYGSSPGGSNTSDCLINSVDIPSGSFGWIYGSGYPTVWHRIFPADFNGDGITDLLTYNNTNWEATIFNGSTGFNITSLPFLLGIDINTLDEVWTSTLNLADYNGDGKSDIMQARMIDDPLTPYKASYSINYSNGSNFSETSSGIIDDIYGFTGLGTVINERTFPFCDFNGDNKSDLYILGITGIDHINEFDITNEFNLAKTFTNGLGQNSEIHYSPLTNKDIYTKGAGATYPLMDIQPALSVVSSLVVDNGIGSQTSTEYLYSGAKAHVQGKGFLGYDHITTISKYSSENLIKTVNAYHLNENYYFSWPESSVSYIGYIGNFDIPVYKKVSETTNEAPIVENFGDKRIFYYTPRSLTKIHSTGDEGSSYVKTTLTKQAYSTTDILYGNLTSTIVFTEPEEVGFSAPEQAYDFYTTSTFTYIVNTAEWLFLIKTAETSTWDKTDATIDKQKNTFTYYPDSPLVHTKTQVPNNSTPMTTVGTYEYTDNYGNLTKSTFSAPGFLPVPPNRVTEYVYDADYQYRFVTEAKNTLNGTDYVTSSTYDPATGLLETSTDLNGLVTAYEYDGFGRLQQTTYPDGVVDKSRLFWVTENPDNPDYVLFYTWSQRSGEQEVLSFADQLGRNLLTVSKDVKDQKVYTETKYNNMGQVDRSSNPHYSTSDLQWTTYEYLTTGAVKKVISPTATVEYTYDGRTVTTTNTSTTPDITTSKEANAIGQVIKATDPGGTINYTYYSSGQPKMITAGGATTLLYYDAAGYQEKLIEPDAGTILYDYNPFGELISQTNANLHTYKMTYDGLGRIINKTLEGSLVDNTSYTYCPEGTHGFGQLQTVSGSNAIETSYTYDKYSRIIEKNQLIDGKKYNFNYDYNVYGKARIITWPTGFSIKYRYKKGYLSAVEENSTGNKLWELTDINAQGQVTQFQLGNKLLTTKEYNPYGFPTTIYTESGVQDLKYDFNINSGNLNWRQGTVSGQTLKEDFTYDETGLNNRLMTWQVGTGTHYSVDYFENGNMDSKSDVGTYLYNTGDAGPHAVGRIKDPDAAYLAMAKINKQELAYTGFDKTSTIRQYNPANPEQASVLEITYSPGQARKKTEFYQAGVKLKTKIFVDGTFETIEDANLHLQQLHYISGGDGLFAIYVIDQDGKGTMNYIHKDYLGSFETITDNQGAVVERLNYDPWGRRRNPHNWTFTDVPVSYTFDQGYTGHEHLDAFGLINMNGRMYDPMLGRFLSPDNNVQTPDYTQNYNRYSYVMNNPLKYTDPSGESYMSGNLGMYGALAIFIIGSISDHLLNPGDYNDKNTGAAIEAGYKQGLHAFKEINSVGQINLYQDDHWNVSINPSYSSLGINVNASYSNGDFTIGGGVGVNSVNNPATNSTGIETSAGGGITYYNPELGVGGTIGNTWFRGVNPQSNALVGLRVGGVSFRTTNDFFSGDKFRTAAAELGYNDLYIGFNVYTGDHNDIEWRGKETQGGGAKWGGIWGEDRNGTYATGDVYSSPFYIGMNYMGNSYRVGINHPIVQDIFQNGMHQRISTPSFRTPYGSYSSLYLYSGQYQAYKLY